MSCWLMTYFCITSVWRLYSYYIYICLVLICLQDDVMTKFSLVCTLIVLCTNHIIHVVNFKGLIQCSESTIKVNDD